MDFVFIVILKWGIAGAAAATVLGQVVGGIIPIIYFAGENGVAAYGIIMYVNFVFMAIFFGYAIGSAPVIGYHYGAGNKSELKNLFKKSITILAVAGVLMTVLAEILAVPLVKIFASYDRELFDMTCRGFRIYSVAFVFMGINVWASSFFTALGNGLVSAVLSFSRTLVFQIIAILVLPAIFGIDGIWGAIVGAELAALIMAGGIISFFTKTVFAW